MTDRKNFEYKGCNAVLGTLTAAQKAQKALSAAAIPSRLEKTTTSSSQKGCVWSVQFSCNQLENVRRVLSGASIKVKSFEEADNS